MEFGVPGDPSADTDVSTELLIKLLLAECPHRRHRNGHQRTSPVIYQTQKFVCEKHVWNREGKNNLKVSHTFHASQGVFPSSFL